MKTVALGVIFGAKTGKTNLRRGQTRAGVGDRGVLTGVETILHNADKTAGIAGFIAESRYSSADPGQAPDR